MTDTPHENHFVQAMPSTLTLDVALYEQYLENWHLSDQEKQDVLQTLWDLICEFVYLGFGVSPVQQVIPKIGGQVKTCSALEHGESSCQNCHEQGGEHV
jgi:hypothetical protein